MSDTPNETLADTPKDPVTGAVRPSPGPSERPGTEAEVRAGKDGAPREPGEGETPAGERNAAYQGGPRP